MCDTDVSGPICFSSNVKVFTLSERKEKSNLMHTKSTAWRKGKKTNFTVEKLDEHYLGQVTKIKHQQ